MNRRRQCFAGMNNRDIIDAALARYVTILCDGAYDTEGDDAHLDVIALAYVMPPAATEGWGAWPLMIDAWYSDGRCPKGLVPDFMVGGRHNAIEGPFVDRFRSDDSFAADMVAKAIADGLDDKLLFLWREDEDSEVDNLDGMQVLLELSRIAGVKQGTRLVDHLDEQLLVLEREDLEDRWLAALTGA